MLPIILLHINTRVTTHSPDGATFEAAIVTCYTAATTQLSSVHADDVNAVYYCVRGK